MKNKRLIVTCALLAAAALVLFAGCTQTVDGEVKIKYSSPSTPSTATLASGQITAYNTTFKYAVLSWDAVDNAGGYSVFAQEEGKKTLLQIARYGDNNMSPNAVFDSTSTDPNQPIAQAGNVDKWLAWETVQTNGRLIIGKRYRLGVRTESIGGGQTNSGIKWSEYLQF